MTRIWLFLILSELCLSNILLIVPYLNFLFFHLECTINAEISDVISEDQKENYEINDVINENHTVLCSEIQNNLSELQTKVVEHVTLSNEDYTVETNEGNHDDKIISIEASEVIITDENIEESVKEMKTLNICDLTVDSSNFIETSPEK